MFDISFTEIMVIAVVAVIVVGPERLPKTVRTVAHVLGRAQRYVSDIKSDIQREMELEDFKKATQSIKDIGKDIESTVRSTVDDAQKSVQSLGKDLQSVESELKNIATETTSAQENDESETTAETTVETTAETADESVSESEASPVTEKKTDDEFAHDPAEFSTDLADYQVPSFLNGEVELSVPEAPAPDEQKARE